MTSDPAQQLLQRQVTQNPPQGQVQAQFTASITGNVLNVTAVAQGVVAAGLQLGGTSIPPGLYIVQGATGAQVPGTIPVVGGGTPTGSGLGANNPSAPAAAGVVTGQSGSINTGNSGSTGNQVLTGTGGVGTYLLNQALTVGSEAMTGSPAQINTGPSVAVNSNPVAGAINDNFTAPGAVGANAKALPYSPGSVYTPANQINVAGVNTPVVPLPAAGQEQISYGNPVINVTMRQGSQSDTGMVT